MAATNPIQNIVNKRTPVFEYSQCDTTIDY